jgi:formiminotetrahydrofolate cyclodeaminase
MTLLDGTVRNLLDAFASSDPAPGGGSAAALAGAVGTSLLVMVARLPKTRQKVDEERPALDAALERLLPIRAALARLVDADADAYAAVVAAYRLPKSTPDEGQARREAIQAALQGAIETPLHVMRHAASAATLAVEVARHGSRSAASDVTVALELLRAAVVGARANVQINLGGVAGAGYAESVRAESAGLEARLEADRTTATGLLASDPT